MLCAWNTGIYCLSDARRPRTSELKPSKEEENRRLLALLPRATKAPPCILRGARRGFCSAGLLNDERPSYDDLSKENLGIGLLSHTKVCSIMGDEELDCRVRNGIGYTLFSMDTKEIFKMYN